MHLYRGNEALQATTESQVYRVSQVNQDLQDIRHMVQGWAASCTITFQWHAAEEMMHRDNRLSLTRCVFFFLLSRASDHRWPGSQMEKWDLKPWSAAPGWDNSSNHSQQWTKWSLHFQKIQRHAVTLIWLIHWYVAHDTQIISSHACNLDIECRPHASEQFILRK